MFSGLKLIDGGKWPPEQPIKSILIEFMSLGSQFTLRVLELLKFLQLNYEKLFQ